MSDKREPTRLIVSSARSSALFRPLETKIRTRPDRITSYLAPAPSRSGSNHANKSSNCSEVMTNDLLATPSSVFEFGLRGLSTWPVQQSRQKLSQTFANGKMPCGD